MTVGCLSSLQLSSVDDWVAGDFRICLDGNNDDWNIYFDLHWCVNIFNPVMYLCMQIYITGRTHLGFKANTHSFILHQIM